MDASALKAVFISYASQDASTVNRIAAALRASGVEVWFDQNELRGGDAWDEKIRAQIAACALFVPVISRHTQARTEGYFRREWNLAVERTRDLAEDVVFLMPVVIDETPEGRARVPEKFREKHWTRLPDGETPTEFCTRVRNLLAGEPTAFPTSSSRSFVRAAGITHARSRWLAVAVIAGAVALLLWLPWHRPLRSGPEAPLATGVERDLAHAREFFAEIERGNLGRDPLDLADELCQKALQREPARAEAWALAAQISAALWNMGHDATPARWTRLNTEANRAIKLAPDSADARFAYALALAASEQTRPEAERLLHDLVARYPEEKRFLRQLAAVLPRGQETAALAIYARATRLPGGDPAALLGQAEILLRIGRDAEAERAADDSLAQRPCEAAYVKKIEILVARGDVVTMRRIVSAMPPSLLRSDDLAYCAALTWLGSRDSRHARAALAGAPRDFLSVRAPIAFEGPKAYLEGLTYVLDGSREAARAKWEAALEVLEQHRAQNPDHTDLLLLKAELLARLGKPTEAAQTERTARQLADDVQAAESGIYKLVFDTVMGRHDAVIARLDQMEHAGRISKFLRALLRHDLRFDPLRDDPRFQALLVTPRQNSEAASR